MLDQHKPLLSEAALHRQAVLARHMTPASDQSRDEIKVTLLADLQEYQDKEGRILTEKITEMVNGLKILHYTRGITPKRVTCGGDHLRGLAPG